MGVGAYQRRRAGQAAPHRTAPRQSSICGCGPRCHTGAAERDPRLAALFMLGALTGMRRGELCALKWSDVDFEHAELEVSRALILVPGGLAEKSTRPAGCGQWP